MEKKDILDQTKGVAVEVYKDLLHPAVEPIGTILSYLPRTIRLAFGRWEKWLINGEESLKLTSEAIKEKVKKIPNEKIVEPEPNIVIPAIQQLCYCEDSETLRKMYANLIVSSMNVDIKKDAHPSFVEIIKQLNSDEAKLLSLLPNSSCRAFPLVDVFDREVMILTNYTDLGTDILEHHDNICSYIDNLLRLNLIEIPTGYFLSPERYKGLEESEELHGLCLRFCQIHKHTHYTYNHKVLRLTNFGIIFKEVCCEQSVIIG